MRNCYICDTLTPNYFNAKGEFTNYTGKPVAEVFSLLNGSVPLNFEIICNVCLEKCNEFDEHTAKADQIQKDFKLLLEKKTFIKQEPRDFDYEDNFGYSKLPEPPFGDFSNIKIEHFTQFNDPSDFQLDHSSESDEKPSTSKIRSKKPKTSRKREKITELLNCPEPGCDRRFDNRAKLLFHHQYHSKERPFQCGQCGKTFKTKSCLSSHSRTVHKEKRVICDACGMDFSRKPSLLRHFLAAHFKLRPFVCATCGLAYNNSSSLKSHQFTHDKNNKNFVCPVCAARFFNKYKLTRHMRSHGEKEYECQICHRMLSQRYNLNAHMKAVHGYGADQLKQVSKNIVCQLCGKTFDKQKTLNTHLQNVHDAVPLNVTI